MDEIFYCGFNGFRQVPYQQDKQTITTLISQSGKSFASSSTEKSNKVLGINTYRFSLINPLLFYPIFYHAINIRQILRFQPYIQDVAICWNYLVIADSEGIVKYGLVNGKHGQCRLPLPPGGAKVRQVSATPRHLLVVTENGGKKMKSIGFFMGTEKFLRFLTTLSHSI